MVLSSRVCCIIACLICTCAANPALPWCHGKPLKAPCPVDDSALPSTPWCDRKLSLHQRALSLVSNLSVQEKAVLLKKPHVLPITPVSRTGPVERLGMPVMYWWHEALHGVFFPGSGKATAWPAVIGVAASFNRSLFMKLGELTGTEGRAMCNVQSAFWTPNLNLLREPRWGRGQETPGEDPMLNSEYGVSFVQGLQGNHSKYLRVSSALKHFVAYDSPEDNPDRMAFDARVTDQDLADSYYPAFQASIQRGNASGAMCSYNALNGVPMCANPLLNTLLRDRWGMQGYIVSDCLAFDSISLKHNYTASLEATIPAAYGSGMDLYNCGSLTTKQLEEFMNAGAEEEAMLTTSLLHLLEIQFRLGFFDPVELNPYGDLTPEKDIDTPAWRALAKEAAAQSMVLLLNRDSRLPLKSGRSLAVIGPKANATGGIQGNYATNSPPFLVSPLEGFKKLVKDVTFAQGCAVIKQGTHDIPAAVDVAAAADDVVLVVGLRTSNLPLPASLENEGEGLDRTTLLLPGSQDELVSRVAAASTKPIVLVIISGSCVDISTAVRNPKVGAIIWAGYPGQSGGDAIAEAVMGLQPVSGRLPMSWHFENYTTQVNKTQMDLRSNQDTGYPGRTYRFFTGPVLFEFGHGLSYAEFAYKLSAPASVDALELEEQLQHTRHSPHQAHPLIFVDTLVSNVGSVSSPVSVLLFVSAPKSAGLPVRQLRGFDRLEGLGPNQTRSLSFALSAHDFALADADGEFSVVRGVWTLMVGDTLCQINVRALGRYV